LFQNGKIASRGFCAVVVRFQGLKFFHKTVQPGLKGRTLCMPKKLFLVFVVLLAATAAVAATSDSSSSSATATPAIRTYLMPDLSLKSVISADLLPQVATVTPQPDNLAGGPKRTGFCRCSCGFQCTSSADCGGASCDPFITCCERKGQNSDVEWFRSSLASHKTPPPAAILKADCK
jgi:hypothetical protein